MCAISDAGTQRTFAAKLNFNETEINLGGGGRSYF